uniref:Uncharacterized protein n=1 Tax=Panagrolaimus sp. PS1159 TaxID=55785 RepID=A0AC35FT25_9BILA
MNLILVLSFTLVVFLFVNGDLLTDVEKYNNNFDKLITTDYEKLIQLKDSGLAVFSETGGAATKAVKSLIDFQWDTLDDFHRKATTNLIQGLTERARRIHLNSQRLFDLLNIQDLENDFDKKVESPLSTGDLWLSLINTTSRDHAKSKFYDYCTIYFLGPIETLNNIAKHAYQYCQIPNERNIDLYFQASYVFQTFEKKFDLDSEYFDLKRGLLSFTLFEGDIAVVEEKIQALGSMNVYFGSELMPKLREIQEDDESNTKCWLEMVFSHSHQRIPDYENFGVVLLNAVYKADDLLMSCQAMNDSIGFMKQAKNITKLVGDYIDVYKHKMIKKAWPSAIERRILEVLPVTTLPKQKYNSTATAIKHAANLMVDKSYVLIFHYFALDFHRLD